MIMPGQKYQNYLAENTAFPFCKGCGHNHIVTRLNDALIELQLEPSKVLLVSDIGCIGLVDSLFPELHTMHTTHGRSTAFATGVEIADAILNDSGMKTLVIIGDGGAMIGLLHLANAALMNVDITVILANNFLFGMTGGQNSNFSPLEFITSTTPRGNMVPPIDICKVLDGCGAGFVARTMATDKDLPHIIAQAIAHPGFALVEVVELCTEYAVKQNDITGKSLADILTRHQLPLGVLRHSTARKEFGTLYKDKFQPHADDGETTSEYIDQCFSSTLQKQTGIVIGGTAGERVQLTAHLLARAAVMSGLECTQKNDNPVTQGSGFSLSEVCISPSEIYYTGIDEPDLIIVTSTDGVRELTSNGTFDRATKRTMLLADTDLSLPETEARLVRYSLRKKMTPARAAAAGVYLASLLIEVVPPEAFQAVINERFGGALATYENDFSRLREAADTIRKKL
jgi:2-oxoglutarate ferredoxin oxidoreductase subunit beta